MSAASVMLYPVVARVPRGLVGREGVQRARTLGRASLDYSSKLTRLGTSAVDYPRDRERAPAPFEHGGTTWHWSTTNTPGLAGGVVAPLRVSIDAEWLDRPRLEATLEYFAADELEPLRDIGLDARRAALSLWSAKEAVIKLTGIGMAGMGRARLERVLAPENGAPSRLAVAFEGERFCVHQRWNGEHVVSIACDTDEFRVQLRVLEESA